MNNLTDIARRARVVIQQLRQRTLQNGEPFMVYDKNLPKGHYYLEYPDGDIKIVTASHQLNDFVVEKDLNSQEVTALRHRLELPAVF